MNADFSSDLMCHRRLFLKFFLGSLLGTELLRCASKSTGIDLVENRLDTVHWLTREGRSSDPGNFYGTSSRRNIDFSATAICDFPSDPFCDSTERFLLAAEVIVLRRVLKILQSLHILARVVESRQSSVKK